MFTSPSTFARRIISLDEAKYAILGVPYDSSESYRSGARLAPTAIREASRDIEDFDMEADFDLLKLKICDCGDVEVSFGNFEETCMRIGKTLEGITSKGAVPVALGGEHTITYCLTKALPEDAFILILDAHLDFRDEYIGNRFSHACVTRRVAEERGAENVLVAGVRSASREELKAAEEMGLGYLTYSGYEKDREGFLNVISEKTKGKDVYLSLDLDVLDPKEAPGVCNPEPLGFGYRDMLELLGFIKECDICGIDVVEGNPLYDSYTPILAAKLIFKVLTLVECKKL